MSDIIKDAKQLLDGATPGPWEWVGYSLESEHGIVLDFQCVTEFGMNGASRDVEVTPEDERLIAASPELAQPLAEETWEYIVQVKRGGQWRFYIGESRLPTDRPGLANGFSQKNHAQEFAKLEGEYPTRIVRRRVSPVEAVNDNRFTR